MKIVIQDEIDILFEVSQFEIREYQEEINTQDWCKKSEISRTHSHHSCRWQVIYLWDAMQRYSITT